MSDPRFELAGKMVGSYRVDSLLGAGGYSRVYYAVDERVDREAAIKILLPGEGEDYSDSVVQRFEREARILAGLRDPHSVQMYEYGQTDDGLLYMVFEYIEGDTLVEVRRQHGRLPALRVVKIIEQVLLSLEEAHALGLVHRDIKPANIMIFEHVGRTDQVKVLDFGVGKIIESDVTQQDITAEGYLIGTPRYMSPEQWSTSQQITQQSDIYSLGLVAYELLVGERAVTGRDTVALMRAHIDDEPIELPESIDIPSGLRRVVNRMMSKPLKQRYDSATNVLHDLGNLKPDGTQSDTMELQEGRLKRDASKETIREEAITTRLVDSNEMQAPQDGASSEPQRATSPQTQSDQAGKPRDSTWGGASLEPAAEATDANRGSETDETGVISAKASDGAAASDASSSAPDRASVGTTSTREKPSVDSRSSSRPVLWIAAVVLLVGAGVAMYLQPWNAATSEEAQLEVSDEVVFPNRGTVANTPAEGTPSAQNPTGEGTSASNVTSTDSDDEGSGPTPPSGIEGAQAGGDDGDQRKEVDEPEPANEEASPSSKSPTKDAPDEEDDEEETPKAAEPKKEPEPRKKVERPSPKPKTRDKPKTKTEPEDDSESSGSPNFYPLD